MHVRPLSSVDVPAAIALASERVYTNSFLLSSLEKLQLLGLVGVFDGEQLVAVATTGANCASTDLDAASASVLAAYLAREGRRSASIVGRQPNVRALWNALDGRWGVMRAVRESQPLLVLSEPPAIAPDPEVRRGRLDELEIIFPACVHMFTEEVGVSPISNGMGAAYRDRVSDLITAGRSFVRIADGVVEFKTEIGATSSSSCQLQGVWVAPHLRGRGLSAPGIAAVASIAQSEIAPAAQLYVNDFNQPARRAYERVGFRHEDTFSTIFF
jgi:predicted GNAT family acetyltransferase